MLVMEVDAAVTLVTMEHLGLHHNHALVAVQVLIVSLIGKLLETVVFDHFKHICDQMI